MGHKKVCFDCRKAFSVYLNGAAGVQPICPECGNPVYIINHKFRPPKQSDLKQWAVAAFLKDNGYFFQHAYEYIGNKTYQMVLYPYSMKEAVEFVYRQEMLGHPLRFRRSL